jgi:hypothetical protein
MIRGIFNGLTRLQSTAATMKRIGTPDIIQDIRITPSNYFRNLEGPSHTIVRGREFIIPVDTMSGISRQIITFDIVPTDGSFYLTYDGTDTGTILFSATAQDIEDELILITGLENVEVSGNFTNGFIVRFYGVYAPELLVFTKTIGDELDADGVVAAYNKEMWSPVIKRGDKINDPTFGSLAIDEVNEMVDLGSSIMAYRIRCE